MNLKRLDGDVSQTTQRTNLLAPEKTTARLGPKSKHVVHKPLKKGGGVGGGWPTTKKATPYLIISHLL